MQVVRFQNQHIVGLLSQRLVNAIHDSARRLNNPPRYQPGQAITLPSGHSAEVLWSWEHPTRREYVYRVQRPDEVRVVDGRRLNFCHNFHDILESELDAAEKPHTIVAKPNPFAHIYARQQSQQQAPQRKPAFLPLALPPCTIVGLLPATI